MTSIQDRIRALNLDHVRNPADSPPPATPKPQPPPAPVSRPHLPPRPALPARSNSTQNVDGGSSAGVGNQPNYTHGEGLAPPQRPEKKPRPLPPVRKGNVERPPLPSRDSTVSQNTPLFPPRRESQSTLSRRDSQESISSTISARSSLSAVSNGRTTATSSSRSPSIDQGRKLAPAFDPSTLPALPPKTPKPTGRPPLTSSRSSSNLQRTTSGPYVSSAKQQAPELPRRDPAPTPPPAPPPRPVPSPARAQSTAYQSNGSQPEERSKRSALSMGMNKGLETPPPVPVDRPAPQVSVHAADTAPPPVPTASKPGALRPQQSNGSTVPPAMPKRPSTGAGATPPPPPSDVCMECRDFSAPDSHASRFPRQSIPSQDISWLSHQLTSPFSSATDKARAIFTWCHYNIAYNTEAFFSGRLKPSTPASTISSGLAVCEGYAGVFAALATAAGLECFVVGGHGMGFGTRRLQPQEPCPPCDPSGHAWNMVRIDGGEWKLIDACWGAGHINDQQQYVAKFNPSMFQMSNVEFGDKHFPQDARHQYREDGARMDWETYMRGGSQAGQPERLTVYTGAREEHGLDEKSFQPAAKHIAVRSGNPKQRVQFQFAKVCDHWDNESMGKGKPYMFLLAIGGKDGRKRENLPVRTDGRGHWYVDVAREDLGTPGQTVSLYYVSSVNGDTNTRGMSLEQYKTKAGRVGMGFGGVAAWQLV